MDCEAKTDGDCEADNELRETAAVEMASAMASSSVRFDAAKRSPLFNRLPLDVYMDWLEAHVAPSGRQAALKTAALELPVELPPAWSRYGLDATKWSEAVELITRRFRWLAEVAAAMRRDCRRFVAEESPPAR